jgi:cyanophycinase
MGFILLEGGNEFKGAMALADSRALDLAGGREAPIAIIAAAAAPDNNHERASANGVRWFRSLGATRVGSVPVIDRRSADDAQAAAALASARLIFMLGGFPRHLAQTLRGSSAWRAVQRAEQAGAVVAGSSAGAMVLCEFFYDPFSQTLAPGLNRLPGTVVVPHHDTFGRGWVPVLSERIADAALIGIDEETGLLNDAPGGGWTVLGKGAITVYTRKGRSVHPAGSRIPGPVLRA